MIKTIKIKGNKYELKNRRYRAMWLFEELANKPIADVDGGTKDNLMYIYCYLLASNKNFPYEFDEFVDDILTPELLEEITLEIRR